MENPLLNVLIIYLLVFSLFSLILAPWRVSGVHDSDCTMCQVKCYFLVMMVPAETRQKERCNLSF